MTPAEFSLDALRRWPDVEADNLFAVDAADRLLLDEASVFLRGVDVVVIGDQYGALTLGALELHGARSARVHQDALSGEMALAANARGLDAQFVNHPLDASLVAGARVVLVRLPRSLDALDEIAAVVAGSAAPEAVVFFGGMLKHMTLAMNEVIGRYFGRIDVSRARQKARVLAARTPHPLIEERPTESDASRNQLVSWPRRSHDTALGITVVAHGAAFASGRVDVGTRFLLEVLEKESLEASDAIDLGCGTGVIAVWLARRGLRVLATDQSAAAVASARLTAEANGVADRVTVVRDDALSRQPDASASLIVLNPPFHIGSTVHAGIAHKLFEDAGRVLAPGGWLWAVWNSHLRYKPALQRLVGPTREVARNPKFTVTVSTKH
ncbi:class I SAM-dependent methyltransferase [Diaminobutyricimonas sp. LJ205]|uniref:class I SAM-dependent methyltransferase n=1 Tax=Diaminobutyricimonas sp. LJ205 TaxID=2683590 RepID=UPI0012F50B95|nr:class I SAM-dependent methyltransferase [Diaminobutyricimonas sp. LJ205]